VEGCPVSPEATKVLLERIAFIRETHYGGFYDFTSDLTLKDTAYTSLALGAHTDTTYFTDPAGLQMFHLLSHTEGEGGASLLVDGFHAAKKLKDEDPDAFEALSDISIPCHASGNEGVIITPAKNFPVLNFGTSYPWLIGRGVRSNRARADLIQVRWNNDDRAVLDMSIKHTVRWYDAARKFDKILKSDEMQYWAQLEPGRPLIFDNWRVLHGRSSFTGKRRICGGYSKLDSLWMILR
jgi:trimethyllysine dioxygenase